MKPIDTPSSQPILFFGNKQLNPDQQAAVLDDSPACIVNATVGSGKTTVLIAKILYLHLQKQVPYEEMVVLTFTNKAADEIKQRLLRIEPGLTPEQLTGFGTFHSVAMYLLKEKLPLEDIGWHSDFTILEPAAEEELALELIQTRQLKIKYQNRLRKRLETEYQDYLVHKDQSRYKDDLFLLIDALRENRLQTNQMTFADLIANATTLLRKFPLYPSWIIVDEVQDCDQKQIDFLTALHGPSTRVFAVGDPNQVIYSWRGGSESMFYYFTEQFHAKELSLPLNYRSSQTILAASKRFMQFSHPLEANKPTGDLILVKNHYDPFQEAEYLVTRIQELYEQGIPYHEIAIFYRLTEQEELLDKTFSRYGIPFYHQTNDQPMSDSAVRLMTLHASKGLEFTYVFIIGINPGLIPLAGKQYDEEEEERRLFFVGMTRAKDSLELSYYTHPGFPLSYDGPSKFLRMLPKHLLLWEEDTSFTDKQQHLQDLRKAVKAQTSISPLTKPQAKHPKYGIGNIVSENDLTIEVDFPNYGVKEFLKAFGEVEILSK